MAGARLTVLYTANLAGRLDDLPRLFTLLNQARAETGAPVMLLDLGGSCAPGVWECDATEGRAVLLVLDAMGCNAARLTDPLDEPAARRLQATVTMALCSALPGSILPPVAVWEAWGWELALQAGDAAPGDSPALIIRSGEHDSLDPAARTLWLSLPSGDTIAAATITFNNEHRPETVQFRRYALTDRTWRDPTVAATVEFVRHEARRYQESRSGRDDD